MQNPQTIFVTGGTGNQGGAVARHLVKNGYRVKVLTRNSASPKALKLKELNVELIQGDLNNNITFQTHLENVDGIFSVQTFDYGIDMETQQGINLASLAKIYGVKHFLYSSVAAADLNTGIPHFESKFKIENHIRNSGLPHTILRPALLYENFLIPQVKSRILKGKLVSPIRKDRIQQFIGCNDIGKISVNIFNSPVDYLGKIITLAAEQMNNEQVAAVFSKAMGKKIKYQKLPMLITRLAMGKNLYKMFRWVNQQGAVFIKDLDSFKKEHPGLQTLEEWIALNFSSKVEDKVSKY